MTTTTTTTHLGTISAQAIPTRRTSAYIAIAAFDSHGMRVVDTIVDKASWLYSFQPLMDCPCQRQAMGVTKIVAEYIGSLGKLEARWTVHYAADGKLIDAYERREETTFSQSDLTAILCERFRWLVPISKP